MPYNLTPEERLAFLEECRGAERILNLHWLVERRKDVARFLAGVDEEIAGLKRVISGRRMSRKVLALRQRRLGRLQDAAALEDARERVLGGPGAVGDAAAGG